MSRLVLKASAGTGKTYRLSLEYLLSLYRGVPYSEIFVMTFTRKATAEIRERILEFAKAILLHKEEGQEILKNLQTLAGDVELKEEVLKASYEAMLKNKEKIRIYTIDSFLQMIFHKIVCPYHQAYTMTMLENEEKNEEYYKRILKYILGNKKHFQEMKTFLELSPEKNIESYLDLLKSILYERWKFLLLDEETEKQRSLSYNENWEEYVEKFESIFQEIERIKKKEKNYFTSNFYQKFFSLQKTERMHQIEIEPEAFIDAKLFKGNRLRSNVKETEAKLLREELVTYYEEFQKNIAKFVYQKKMLPYEKELLGILEKIYALYDEYKWEERSFTYLDVTIYTYLTLFQKDLDFVQNGKITDLLEESLDIKIHSLFLDEFQDTSLLQWKILSVFIQKAKEVICVGDEKQSIYGWRGGEKKLFEHLAEILAAKEETLDTSYRSLASIIDFTNEIFQRYPEQYQEKNIIWNFQTSKSKKEKRAEVTLTFQEEESLEDIADIVKEKYSSQYGSVAILTRKNKTLQMLANLFEEKKIPYQLFTEEGHEEEEVIASFLPLFRYFITEEYLYLLEFFRSPLIQASNQTLKRLIREEDSVVEYIKQGKIFEDLSEECKRIKELYDMFQQENGKIGDSWLKSITLFSVSQYFSKDKNFIAWYRFQEILSSYTTWQEYFYDLDRDQVQVYDVWEEENKNAISLMTIHKSKGLEFENVIYYEPKSRSGGKDYRKLLFYCDFSKDYQRVISSFLTSNRYKKFLPYLPEEFSTYLIEEEKKTIEEEINNFYVALTRAKYNLHLFLPEKDKRKEILESSLHSIQQGDFYIGDAVDKTIVESKEGIELFLEKEEKEYLSLDKKSPKRYTEQTEWNRMEGIATHFFLEQLCYATEEEISFAKKKVFQEYTNYFGLENMNRLFSEKRILELLQKEPLIFSKKWDRIYREYAILEKETKKKYIIDRLMIKISTKTEKGEILIIDYKTGGSDLKQLEHYETLVRESLGAREVQYEISKRFLNFGREGEEK